MTTVPSRYKVIDVISRTRHAFGDEDSVQITDADIIGWLNEAINRTAVTLKYIQGTATIDLSAGFWEIQMPQVQNITEVVSIEVNGSPLPFVPFAEHQSNYQSDDPQGLTTGKPMLWTRWGDTIRLWPKPEQDYSVVLYYIGLPDPVVNASDTIPAPDRYFTGLCSFVMARAYELDEDYDAQRTALQEYERVMDLTLENEGEQQTLLYPVVQMIE